MQKVERRKAGNKKNRRGIWVFLCLLILAGSVTAAVLLNRSAEEEAETEEIRIAGSITEQSTEDIETITIRQRGQEAWTVVRTEEGSLLLRQPDGSTGWAVDDSISYMLQDALANLTYEDIFTENRGDWADNAADFGLEDPLVTAECRFTDGTVMTVRIGNSADPGDDSVYYMTLDGDDRLYAVTAGTVQDLNVEKTLLHPVVQPQIRGALLDRITVMNGDEEVIASWELQGEVTDQDAEENWLVTAPFTYPADYEFITNLKENAGNLRLGTFVADVTEETLKTYGLDQPVKILELHMAAGSTGAVSDFGVYGVTAWEEESVELIVGKAKSEMVDYVRFGNEIFAVSHFTLSAVLEAEPLASAARYLAPIPLNALASVTVEKPGEEAVEYALEHLSEAGSDEPLGTCVKNGEKISWEAFAAAYERMLTVTVSGRLPEGTEKKETAIKYTFRSVTGGTHTAELSDFDGMHDTVTVDGHSLFYLIKKGLTELP